MANDGFPTFQGANLPRLTLVITDWSLCCVSLNVGHGKIGHGTLVIMPHASLINRRKHARITRSEGVNDNLEETLKFSFSFG
jgi:hypothetical protein